MSNTLIVYPYCTTSSKEPCSNDLSHHGRTYQGVKSSKLALFSRLGGGTAWQLHKLRHTALSLTVHASVEPHSLGTISTVAKFPSAFSLSSLRQLGLCITISSLLSTTIFSSPLRISVFAAGSALEPCSRYAPRATAAVTSTAFSQKRRYAKKKMAPKKAVEEKKVLLGRPGNNLKSGIVCRQSPSKSPRDLALIDDSPL